MHNNNHIHRHKWTGQAEWEKRSSPKNMPWCIPWNLLTPQYQNTTSQNLLSIPLQGEETQRTELLLSLPLGGGKLRCRDVLGLGSGRGSCLNPERWGRSGDEGKRACWISPRAGVTLCEGNVKGTGLWCWFQGCVTLKTASVVSWL